jgi:hypothetical protein
VSERRNRIEIRDLDGVLRRHDGSIYAAAKALGVSHGVIRKRLREEAAQGARATAGAIIPPDAIPVVARRPKRSP